MRISLQILGVSLLAFGVQSELHARGFGGARGGATAGPRGGTVSGGTRVGGSTGAYGGSRAGGVQGGTYTGPRGGTVEAGRAGGVTTGPYGGVHAGGVQGAKVTTPGGRTYTTGSAGGATVGPGGGVHAHGASGSRVAGPGGGAAVGTRGGVAVGPYGGVAAGGTRVAAGHSTRYVSPTWASGHAAVVRTGVYGGAFTTGWYRSHPAAWVAGRWRVANYWSTPAWPWVAGYCGVAAEPVVYDYGSTIVIQNDYVYSDGTQIASAEEYAQQAGDLAAVGRDAKPDANEEWQPLGVFGMIQGEESVAQHIFQLAINAGGVIRGNYYNAVADSTTPVTGSLDKKTQRVAWSIGDKKDIVFDCGLNNLTQDQTSLLVHYGKERTQQMVLIRLEEPKEK